MKTIQLGALAAVTLTSVAFAQTKLLRFPDVHGDKVAFCYAGDIWTAPSKGGSAVRITAHPGLEVFPKFSPDGKWIAFTGQYDGDEQVYVVAAGGGVPKQLTWYPARGPLPQRWGYDNQVYGWSHDGKSVLFRAMGDGWDMADTKLFLVPVDGGLPKALPMPSAGGGDLSPDDKRVIYSPLARDFRTWKRYEGGWAQDLDLFDLSTHAIEPVAHSIRTERDPMWIGDAIYFDSDRDGFLNLYSYDLKSKKVDELTHYTDADVRWASRGDDGEIVYELSGELHLYDTKSKKDAKLSIDVPNDGVAMRPARVAAGGSIENFDLSPKGERALFAARGDIFTAPIEKGSARNLTNSSSSHEKRASWSPDGSKIVFLSDKSGEEELWLANQDGSGALEQLTSNGTCMRFDPRWSPDGSQIAFSDKSGRLFVFTLATKETKEIARDNGGNLFDYTWSPDSGYLAFTLTDANTLGSIWIWSKADAVLHRVTDEQFNENTPVWDPEGKYLYYLSDREFAPQLSTFEWNFATNRTTGVFALALRKDVAHPFPPESDEVTIDKKDEKKDAKSEEKKDDKPAEAKKEPLKIDFDGLADRVARVPIGADNYRGIDANKDAIFLIKVGAAYYGRESDSKSALLAFDLKERKPTTLAEDVQGFVLSRDGKKLLVQESSGFALYDAAPKGKDSRKAISTDGLEVDRVPAQEWAQIFDEVWRRYRDYFYVDNLHGYDWKALHDRYAQLLTYVAHRADLNYVMGEMVAELGAGHCYVSGGEWVAPKRANVALLGCRFELDGAVGRYRIAHIFAGQNQEERYRSPLTEIGVDVHAGDYLLAVDGVDLPANESPYHLLRNKAERTVELTVGSTIDPARARKVKVKPVSSETDLVYLDWVSVNRARVEKLSNGRLGYIHMPDMGADGIREFIKWFYGVIRKEGLVVDDRYNGGGNVSSMIIERLRRQLLGTEFARNSERTGTYPQVLFNGPMICLLNENSASDGDIFPWMFKRANLGLLVGKRSWGGVVGIDDHGPLIDGGTVSVPEFGHADANGQWAVEGHGVDPDIVVDNDAKSVLDGRDPQLEKAVELLLKELEKRSSKLPTRPAAPVKTPAPIK